MFFTLPGSLPSAHNGEMLESAQTGLERGFSSPHFSFRAVLLLFWSRSTVIFESNLRSLLSEILYQFPLWAEKAHKSTSVSAWIYLSSTTSLNLKPTCHRCISSDSLCSEQNHRGRLGWLRHRLESCEEIWRLLKQHCPVVHTHYDCMVQSIRKTRRWKEPSIRAGSTPGRLVRLLGGASVRANWGAPVAEKGFFKRSNMKMKGKRRRRMIVEKSWPGIILE